MRPLKRVGRIRGRKEETSALVGRGGERRERERGEGGRTNGGKEGGERKGAKEGIKVLNVIRVHCHQWPITNGRSERG
jgi:hypothetical protein